MKTNLPPVEEAILLAEARMLLIRYFPENYRVDMPDDEVVEVIVDAGKVLIKAFREVMKSLDRTHPGWRKIFGIS